MARSTARVDRDREIAWRRNVSEDPRLTERERQLSEAQVDGWPEEMVGNGLPVQVAGGAVVPYAFLDNAASTPVLRSAAAAVGRLIPWYSSVHRGSGFKSQVTTAAYEAARQTVADFVGASGQYTTIFIKNATEGLNRLAALASERQATVFISIMEHHANMLTWRYSAPLVRYVNADSEGVFDQDDLARQLKSTAGAKIVAVAGAYNVTGYTPPIYELARLAHEHGAEIAVDGAQLVPHRRIRLAGATQGDEIDYLVFSAHKIYAPFGSGALVARRQALEGASPALLGGGIVELVTLEDVVWSGIPDREEAGTPNVLGAVALAAALRRLGELGRERLEGHEDRLTAYLLGELARIERLTILGPSAGPDRVGVVSFDVQGVSHSLVAAYLAHEHGIGVRSGCFCAHPGVMHLLRLGPKEIRHARGLLRKGIHMGVPGAVRVSLGIQSTKAEVDRLVAAVASLANDGPQASYRGDTISGGYMPVEPLDDAEREAASILSGEGYS